MAVLDLASNRATLFGGSIPVEVVCIPIGVRIAVFPFETSFLVAFGKRSIDFIWVSAARAIIYLT